MSVSAGIISSSIYFLYRIFSFPEIGNVDAILIGFSLACAIILGIYGISSVRGNVVESSLLVCTISFTDNGTNVSSSPTSLSASTKSSPTTNPPIQLQLIQKLHLNQLCPHCHLSSWLLTPLSYISLQSCRHMSSPSLTLSLLLS
jgi:hypothetical protein